jgi:small subunit ribosomal protein S20
MAKLKTGRHTSAIKAARQADRRNSRNTGLKKGVIHKKAAARKKSRLAKMINKTAKAK